MKGELAVRLRGVVKRYGLITAVAELDLDVPEATCVGLLGPNGAGKSTTMRMLTGQAIADEGELEVLGFRLPDESKQARAQLGVTPQLDNLDVTLTVEQNLLVFTHLYRIGRHERRAAIDRALAMANLADRRAAGRGYDDPDVDPLHRGGAAPRGHGPHHVPRPRRRRRPARRPRRRARGPGGGRGLRPAAEARRGRGRRAGRGPAHAADRNERLRAGRGGCGRACARGRAAARESRGRVRPAHRRGDRLMAVTTPPRGARLGRLERPALTGVLVREIVNFSSYWRSTTFSSTVEPTIYLLAFGFGFGSLVSKIGGFEYVEFVGTGTVATAVLFSSAFPAMFGTFIKYQFQRTYDAILAAPVDTEELVTAEALWIATRAGVYGCVPLLVALAFGLDPSWGMLTVPLIAWVAGFGWACFGIAVAGYAKSIENFSYVVSAVLTPLFLVAGTFFPISTLPKWARILAELNPLHQCVVLVRQAVFGFHDWTDFLRLGVLVVFGLIMWRIAIYAMERKLID